MRWLAACLFLLNAAPVSAQSPSFRVDAKYVKVPVSVFDEQGGAVTGLTRRDFLLFDEGVRRPIENFLLDRAPLHVLLLLDTSGSLREELDEIRRAALRFAGAFSREDRISVIAFADEAEILADWTNRFKRLKKALNKLEPGYRTALYDSLNQVVRERFRRVGGRKAIILLTDGLDNESATPFDELLPTLIEFDITLYIISRTRLVQPKVRDSARVEFLNQVMKDLLEEGDEDDGDFVDVYFREKESSLTRLSESTGGRVLFPEYLEELQSSYVQVARELKAQYVLTFNPPGESKVAFRSIRVECLRDVGRLHFRRQYHWGR